MHPDHDELAGYVFGTLSEDQVESISIHVEACPTCEDTVRNLEATGDDVLANLRQPPASEPFVDESGCERALALIDAIGREPSFTHAGRTQRPGHSEVSGTLDGETLADADLGQVRVYKLLAKLGQGGMGTVYKALHTELDKIVALKVLPADRLQDRAAVDRFKREMKAIGKLEHPNLVRAMDAGEDAGTHYLVMELVDGIDVGELVKRTGPLPVAAACEIVRQTALGLQHAHEHGLVHRDIKPSNIMVAGVSSSPPLSKGSAFPSPPLSKGGLGGVNSSAPTSIHSPLTIKILDMGLALLASHQAGAAEELTSTGQIMGTVDYMAPEQGSDTHRVDIRADLYSLGATLYKLLTGRAPFEGPQFNTTMKKLTALATAAPQPLREQRPDVPPELAAIVHRLLAKTPDERPTSPRAVADLLAPFAAGANLAGLLDPTSPATVTVAHSDGSTATVLAHTANSSPPQGAAFPSPPLSKGGLGGVATPATTSPSAAYPRTRSRLRTWLLPIAALILLGAVIVITTKQGTVTITQPDAVGDQVEIVVRSGGDIVAVMDKSNDWTVTVQNGEYTVSVRGGSDQFQVKDNKLTVKRFGQTLVEVETKPVAVATAGDRDRRAAEWVLSIGGDVKIRQNGQERGIAMAATLPQEPFELTIVGLRVNRKVSDAGLARFENCQNLRELVLGGTQVSDAGLAPFKDCKNIEFLSLFGTLVGDVGLAHFKDCKKLKNLDLCGSQVSDEASAFFQNFKQLSVVGLIRTRVSDVTLEGLASCPMLKSVRVQETQVTEAGVKQLAAALPACKIEWDGGVIEPTPSADPDRRAAEYVLSIGGKVSILHNGEGQKLGAVGELPQGAFELTWVDLLDQQQVSDAGLAVFAECKNLTLLRLSRTSITDTGLAYFKHCKQLTRLDLGHTSISDAGLAHFEGCQNLIMLELNETRVGDAGLANFQNCVKLTRLLLDRTQVSDQGLAQFKNCQSLEVVSLNLTGVSDVGLTHFQDCKNLKYVDLSGTKVSDAGLEHLKNCQDLQHLVLQDTNVSDAGLERLADFPKFASVNVKKTKVTEAGVKQLSAALPKCKIEWDGGVIEPKPSSDPDRRAAEWVLSIGGTIAIKQNGQERGINASGELPPGVFELTRVELSQNRNVDDVGLARLQGCQHLTNFSVRSKHVSDVGLAHVKDCKQLTYLALQETQVTDAGLAHFKDCQHLTALSLITAKISDAGLAHFKDCVNLTKLHLAETQVSGAGLVHFKNYQNLTFLNLASTQVDDAGMAHLKECTNLSTLHLYTTQVSDTGLVHLKACKNLSILDLDRTPVGDAGLEHLAGTPKLANLIVTNTKVTEAGVKKLAAALPACKIKWDGGVIEPQPSTDANRRAME